MLFRSEQIPHFSTVSYNFKHRYTEKTIEEIFYWILNEIETAGYLSPEAVFVDGTHIKANANLKKAVKKAVPQAAKIYEKQLMEEINEERNDHGKKPFDETKPPEEKEISESTTDPESGVFHKGERKKCFAYTAQTCCDKNGYIMDVRLTRVEPVTVSLAAFYRLAYAYSCKATALLQISHCANRKKAAERNSLTLQINNFL